MTFSNALFFYALFASCSNQPGHKSFGTAQLKLRGFFLQEEQSWANWSCPDRCRLSFQSTATEILFWEKSHQKHLRKCTLVEQQGACTVFEGDSKPPVLTDSRTNTVSTSQIQDLLYPSSPWSQQLPGFRCKLSTFQLLEAVARVVNSGDNSGK